MTYNTFKIKQIKKKRRKKSRKKGSGYMSTPISSPPSTIFFWFFLLFILWYCVLFNLFCGIIERIIILGREGSYFTLMEPVATTCQHSTAPPQIQTAASGITVNDSHQKSYCSFSWYSLNFNKNFKMKNLLEMR